MWRSFNYFINTSFFISVYKITVCTSTQKWFTKSMSSAHMLMKNRIYFELHVRHKGDNAPFYKVLNALLLSIHRDAGHVKFHAGHMNERPKTSTTKRKVPWLKSTWNSLCVPFFPPLSIAAEEKSWMVPKKSTAWIHQNPLDFRGMKPNMSLSLVRGKKQSLSSSIKSNIISFFLLEI